MRATRFVRSRLHHSTAAVKARAIRSRINQNHEVEKALCAGFGTAATTIAAGGDTTGGAGEFEETTGDLTLLTVPVGPLLGRGIVLGGFAWPGITKGMGSFEGGGEMAADLPSTAAGADPFWGGGKGTLPSDGAVTKEVLTEGMKS